MTSNVALSIYLIYFFSIPIVFLIITDYISSLIFMEGENFVQTNKNLTDSVYKGFIIIYSNQKLFDN